MDKGSTKDPVILLEIYKQSLDKLMEDITKLREKVYEAFSHEKSMDEANELVIESRILSTPFSPVI